MALPRYVMGETGLFLNHSRMCLSVSPSSVLVTRARFTAYAKGLPQFIVDTTHPDCPIEAEFKLADGSYGPGFLEEATKFCDDYEFSKVSIIQSTVNEESDEAKVLFKVRSRRQF